MTIFHQSSRMVTIVLLVSSGEFGAALVGYDEGLVTAAGAGSAWAAEAEITGKDGAMMVLVPAGEFVMGSDDSQDDAEKPAHRVFLDAFYIDKHEVTVGRYARLLEATGAKPPMKWDTIDQAEHRARPVVFVDWEDAAMYCRWAGKRLPTEAEWEKAARGTDGRIYPWGNDPPTPRHTKFGARWKGYDDLLPVGSLEDGKSPYGNYDMAGNAWEWVSDWYDQHYYKTSPSQNPKGPKTSWTKVLRGGRGLSPEDVRSWVRSNRPVLAATEQISFGGIRCARTP
jgi:formylglycine-generating enzyme required for sulfatase activity